MTLPFTRELTYAFSSTYEAIGFDLWSDGDDKCISRKDLFTTCLDYVCMYGELDQEVLDYWKSLSLESKKEYMPFVFKYESYEVGH